MVWGSAIAACAALEVVSVVKTLLGLGAEGEGRDLGGDVWGGRAGHDGFACGFEVEELVEDRKPSVKMTR